MADDPLPDLILYGRADCGLCAETRELVVALLADREAHGLRTANLVERDIETHDEWHRRYLTTIPVLELGDRQLELATSLSRIRGLLSDVLDGERATA